MNQTGTIGIVGGGQLGRMLTEAALPLGFKVVILDPGENCPAAQVGAEQILGTWNNKKALEQLVQKSDFITYETEHFDVTALHSVPHANPLPETVGMIQDKFAQKLFLSSIAPIAPFSQLGYPKKAKELLTERWKIPMIIKTRRGGFDGRGNMVVRQTQDVDDAFEAFSGQELYAEKLVSFTKELAVIVARDTKGHVKTYPVTETMHQRNICVETLTPAQITKEIEEKATELAVKVATHLEGVGVFAIEMFLTDGGEILINEIAPRVHNSGHYTIEACETSQFEQHIRAVTGMGLGSTKLKVDAAVMVNILGERDGPTEVKGLDEASAVPDTAVHVYGKSPTKVDRKMGHITSTGTTLAEARERAEQARKLIDV